MDKKWFVISLSVILLSLIFTLVAVFVTKGEKKYVNEQNAIDGEIILKSQEGNYSLKITTVYDVPPETDEVEVPEAQRVAVVVYEYTNDDISNGLSIGNTHFKAYDSKGKELDQFPQKNLFEPSEVGAEGTFTASVAFALNNDKNFIKVEFYNDTASKKPDAVFEQRW